MIIAELGLNHLGDEMLAMKYVDKLASMAVDGITFQVPQETGYLPGVSILVDGGSPKRVF